MDRPYLRVWDLRDPPPAGRAGARLGPAGVVRHPDAPGTFPRSPGPSASIAASSTPGCNEAPRRPSRAWSGRPCHRGQPRRCPGPSPARPRPGQLEASEEAVADFTAALKASPNDAHLLASRARGRRLERLDAAIADAEAALLRQEPAQAERDGPGLALQQPGLDAGDRSRPRSATRPAPLDLARRAVGAGPRPGDLPEHARRRPLSRRTATPRPCPSWSTASPPARGRPTPSTCSSWPWPATGSATPSRPAPISTGPSSDLLICGSSSLRGCEAYPLAGMRFGRFASETTRVRGGKWKWYLL